MGGKMPWLLPYTLALLCCGFAEGLDLHLEGAVESNFFFQQSLGSSQQPLLRFPPQPQSNESKPLLRERLAVLGPSATHPGSIRVAYGPFEAKQSLPARYLSLGSNLGVNNSQVEQQTIVMDITAHVVNTELRRESPVLRVLFHSGRHFHHQSPVEELDDSSSADNRDDESRPLETCIALRVHNPNMPGALTATCVPQGLDGVCLTSLTIPFDWWTSPAVSSPTFPSLQQPLATAKPAKAVRNTVELSYSVYETKSGQCGDSKAQSNKKNGPALPHQQRPGAFPPPSAVLVQPSRPITSLRLLPNVYAPRDLLVHEEAVSLSPTLRFIASAAPLYPQSHFYVTVLLDSTGTSTSARDEPYAIVVRAKVKHGLKIISTQTTNPAWSLSFDVNGKHIAAAVTAVRNFSVSANSHHSGSSSNSQELFTWLLSVNADHHKDQSSEVGVDGVRALWSWTIRSQSTGGPPTSGHHHVKDNNGGGLDEVKGRLTSRFEVLKDEVQSVFPIIKRKDLVNTAILTSRQVSEPLRVFMVTQAGKVADVTLQASCLSLDESVLKVSSSCTSVYLDGSEVRGSTNASLVARYGSVEATSSLTVWVPELPLDIQLDDVKLNQISGWKVPAASTTAAATGVGATITGASASSSSPAGANNNNNQPCRNRYQQSSFEVFARFYAEDHDSGRVSYLISRKTYLLITDLVRKVLRVSDPRVAALRSSSSGSSVFGNLYVEGLKPGKAEVQVLSPMTGHVIATRELRVLADKVDVTSLSARSVAGLSLSLTPDPDLDSSYVAVVEAQERLHSKYQEAILDLTVHFSDGQSTPLRVVERGHYSLTVESHNASILALTSPPRASVPRVLALGEGRAAVTAVLASCGACSQDQVSGLQPNRHPLATVTTQVVVSLSGQSVPVQNDARTESSHSFTVPSTNQIIGEFKRNGKLSGSGSRAGQQQQLGQGQLTFSKPGSTEFGSVNENQLSLKDDSNAVMIGRGAEHHNYAYHPTGHSVHHSGWHISGLEIGMYVLLGIFCVAIFIFVGTCVVYASRARKGLIVPPPLDPLSQAPPSPDRPPFWNRWKRNPDPEYGTAADDDYGEEEEERTDKGWIWLGRSSLEDEPVPSCHPSEPDSVPQVPTAEEDHRRNSKRMSGISYCGSEVSVKITSRPDGREGYEAQLCFESLPPAESPVNSNTFTKSGSRSPINITTNQLAEEPALILAKVIRRPRNRNSPAAVRRQSEQDTRRYARSWLMAGEAVPRDFNSNPSSLNGVVDDGREDEAVVEAGDNSHQPDPKGSGYNLATFLRYGSPDIKEANIVENPRHSGSDQQSRALLENNGETETASHCSNGNDELQQEQLSVDYDRIISYLGILKETSA